MLGTTVAALAALICEAPDLGLNPAQESSAVLRGHVRPLVAPCSTFEIEWGLPAWCPNSVTESRHSVQVRGAHRSISVSGRVLSEPARALPFAASAAATKAARVSIERLDQRATRRSRWGSEGWESPTETPGIPPTCSSGEGAETRAIPCNDTACAHSVARPLIGLKIRGPLAMGVRVPPSPPRKAALDGGPRSCAAWVSDKSDDKSDLPAVPIAASSPGSVSSRSGRASITRSG